MKEMLEFFLRNKRVNFLNLVAAFIHQGQCYAVEVKPDGFTYLHRGYNLTVVMDSKESNESGFTYFLHNLVASLDGYEQDFILGTWGFELRRMLEMEEQADWVTAQPLKSLDDFIGKLTH